MDVEGSPSPPELIPRQGPRMDVQGSRSPPELIPRQGPRMDVHGSPSSHWGSQNKESRWLCEAAPALILSS